MGSHMRRMKGRLMARRGARTRRLPAALALLLAAALLTSFLPAAPPPVAASSVPGGGAPPPGSGAKTSTPQVRVIDGMTIDTYIDGVGGRHPPGRHHRPPGQHRLRQAGDQAAADPGQGGGPGAGGG